MTCVQCQEYLNRILDGGADEADATVAAHLAGCPTCGQWTVATQRLRTGVRLLPAPRPPEDFAQRVATLIVADQRRRRLRRRWYVGAALAASLLLAILGGYRWFGSQVTNTPNPAPIAAVEKVRPQTPIPTPSARESIAEAGEAVASLSRKATEETVEQTRLLWPVAAAPVSFEGLDLQTPLEPSAQSLREASQNVSSGLEPVASSARRAVNLFWRELPPVGSEKGS